MEFGRENRRKLAANGATVFNDLASAAGKAPAFFQLITLFQVLEHISEFRSLLTKCRKLLAPKGLLFVTVPDCDAMIRQERMTGCPDMPPNHVNKWTPKSLALVLEEAGFSP